MEPAPPCPALTQPQAEEHFLKYEAQRAKKVASKSHRERIKELNEVSCGGGWGCCTSPAHKRWAGCPAGACSGGLGAAGHQAAEGCELWMEVYTD